MQRGLHRGQVVHQHAFGQLQLQHVAGGAGFLCGLLTYLASFFIGPAADEAEQRGAVPAAA